jgi:hypothetical protein
VARRTFPDEGSRLAYSIPSATGVLTGVAATPVKVYTNSACTTLADIQTTGGAAIPGSILTVDANSLLPLFLGPADASDTLYVRAASLTTGTGTAIYARADDRLDQMVQVSEGPLLVTRYGAVRVEDGGGDNTSAFADAVAAADDVPGGEISLPRGTWLGRIALPPTVTLSGQGDPASTIKLPNGANADVITRAGAHGQFIKVKDLRVDGNKANNSSGRGIVLSSLFVTSGLHHVTVVDCAGKGIAISSSDEFVLDDVWVANCGDIGLDLTQCTEVRAFAVASERSGDPCMRFTQCDTVIVAGHLGVEQTTGSGKKGIVFDSCIGVIINGVFVYGGNAPGVQLTALEWNSAAVPGRAARLFLAQLTSAGFVNSLVDQVNGVTETVDSIVLYADSISPNAVTSRSGLLTLGTQTRLQGLAGGAMNVNYNNGQTGSIALFGGGTAPLVELVALGQAMVKLGVDTNLYRAAANQLKTDDALTVADVLTAGKQLALTATTAPAAPPSGGLVYVDAADGRAKLIVPDGTITVIG